MTKTVQITDIPRATKVGGRGKVYLTRVDVEDIGVVIGGPDKEGDLLVLFDERVERISPACLTEVDSPLRASMWDDMFWLEVGDEFEAVDEYIKHVAYLRRLTKSAEKKCSICGETKPLGDFGFDANKRDGYSVKCKTCDVARKK